MDIYDALDSRLAGILREADDFLYGQCHLFAIALHHLTGLPLVGAIDIDFYDESHEYLMHAYVELNDSMIIDVAGVRKHEKMLEDFDYVSPHCSYLTEKELLQWGEGREYIDEEAKLFLQKAFVVAIEILFLEMQLEVLRKISSLSGSLKRENEKVPMSQMSFAFD